MRVLLTIKIISAIFAKTGLGMIPTTSNFTLQAKKNRHLFQSVSPQFAAKKAAENEKKKQEARKQATEQLVELIDSDRRTYWDFIDPREDYPSRIEKSRKEYRSHIEPIIRKAKKLISKGTDVNVLVDYSRQVPCPEGRAGCNVWHGEIEKRPLLTNVILKGFPEMINLVLQAGADPKKRGNYIDESDPLFVAVKIIAEKDYDFTPRAKLVIEYLLDHGADPNVGLQALLSLESYRAHDSFNRLLELFISAGADVNTKYRGMNPLKAASERGLPIQKYIDLGVDPNWFPSNGDSALTAIFGTEYGIGVNALDNVTTLINAGVDVNHRGAFGETALIKIANKYSYWRHYSVDKIIRTLLRAGADPSIKDNMGRSAFDYAQTKLDKAENEFNRSDALELIKLLNEHETIRKQTLKKIM